MAHLAVGALTAIAFVLIIGEADRFGCGKQIAAMSVWFRREIPAESDADSDNSGASRS